MTGVYADRLGPRLLLTIGPFIAACGLAMLAFVDFKRPYWVSVFPPIVLLGVGMAITVPPLTSTVMAAAGKAHAGIASGVNNAVARVAGLLAVAGLGAVLFANFSFHLGSSEPAKVSDALNAVMSGHPGVAERALASFEDALRTIMLLTASCAAIAGAVGRLWIEANNTEADPAPLAQ
ncbi:MFS transporter [Bradyrhizobium japonicum]|nr:MFS transporter [Bradyrhizobium japonicum]